MLALAAGVSRPVTCGQVDHDYLGGLVGLAIHIRVLSRHTGNCYSRAVRRYGCRHFLQTWHHRVPDHPEPGYLPGTGEGELVDADLVRRLGMVDGHESAAVGGGSER